MKSFNGYEAKKSSGGRELLPVGGYVAKILEAKEQEYTWGNVLILSFDIIEGEHKNFFADDYKAQTGEDKKWRGTYRINIPKEDGSEKDGWTKRSFGNAMWAVEESNPGYHWDWNEAGLKGKLVGLLYRNFEWEVEGKNGWSTECGMLMAVYDIRDGKYKPMKDRPLKAKKMASVFTPEAEISDSDLPFII